MQKLLREYMDELNKRHKKNRRTGIAILVLVVIVFGSVMGVLTQYGVAMTGRPQCGLEEHTHAEECYEKALICGLEENEGHTHTDECLYPAELTCGLEESEGHTHTDECLYPAELTCGQEESEEHIHTEECYTVPEGYACGLEESEGHTHTDECYTVPEGYACGLEEGEKHVHTDECYEETLICGKEEHIHTDACYIDAAAVEDPAVWDSQYAQVEWKDAWGEDLVTAAQMQIGYQESSDNYTAAADGSQKGYTRFGHFAGDMYADWDAAFVNFCLHYAGIKESGFFPEETDTAKWYEAFVQIREENAAYLTTPENYVPAAGDIVFFQKENEETADQMGIVSSVNEENRTIAVIEGNNGNEVKETEYSLDDAHIVNYLMISGAENGYKNAGDAGEAAAEENWAYEESFETENVVIHVKAKEGVVPEGAVLSVTPIEKTEITEDMPEEEAVKAEEINEQYELTNQKLLEESEKKEEVLQGFLAYDICFIVDGTETEPNGEVNVTMEFKEAVKPEGVSEDAVVAVSHLKEDETAEDGIVVEDLTEKEAATVITTEENASVEKVELVAESFSTFVIQWSDMWQISFNINAEYLDENGQVIDGINEVTIQISGAESWNLKEVMPDQINSRDKSYSVKEIKVANFNIPDPSKAEYFTATAVQINSGQIVFLNSNDDSQMSCQWGEESYLNMKIYCTEITALRIKDNIVEDGTLIAEGGALEEEAAKAGQTCRYVWYKRINNAVGNDGEPVYEEVQFLRYEGGLTNLSSDRTSLNVALDKGALNKEQTAVEYKVALQISDENGEVIQTVESEPFSIKYYSDIQNGSFEEPIINSSHSYAQLSEIEVPGWNSTSTLKGTAEPGVEIVRVMDTGHIYSDYGESGQFGSAAEGRQFAELNCESDGSLYQDVLTIPGRPLSYYFSHRGRYNSGTGGKDTMMLIILPTKIAKSGGKDGGPIDTQEEVLDLMKNLDKYPEVNIYTEDCTAAPGRWTDHSGEFTPTDSLVRFFFVSTQTETRTQGNFLDNIWFGQDLPIPSSNTYNLRIEKTVQGLGVETVKELKEKLQDLNFKITVQDEKGNQIQEYENLILEASEMTWEPNSDGSYTGFYNYLEKDIEGTYTVSVTENGQNIAGYDVKAKSNATVSGQGTLSSPASGNESVNIDVRAKQSVEVAFSNTYTEKLQPVVEWQMIKCSTSTDSTGNKLFLPEAEFTVSTVTNGSDGKEESSVVAKGTSGKDGVIIWKAVDDDGNKTESIWQPENDITYTITETKAPAGYSLMSGPLQVTFRNGTPVFEGNENVEEKKNVDGDTTITFYLKNTPVYSLPSTGGSGIFWYMFSGVLLMAGATLFLYKNKVQGGAGKLG